ncbi:MAG TPA: DUF1295 domain-containing protein [Pseudonocardiaceae bacterium]|jgi:steroid 5-alpha reductase family enzyme|nr:DUF1295 domain-containing protein [Pseudonocardiaceae bacterium]
MAGVSLTAVLVNLGVTLAVAVWLIVATFVIARRRQRWDTIDSVWGLGFVVVALVSLGLSGGHGELLTRLLVTVLTAAWGLRLSVHIHRRNHGRDEDPRYRAMADKAGDRAAGYLFTRVYLVQALLLWFVSWPVQIAQYLPVRPTVLVWLGVLVWLVGFVFESVGDQQLSRFKADPGNRGKILDTGLWRYTRHPNYFGDACVWWGLYLTACGHWLGAVTVLSPLVMTALLAKGSGKPMTEKRMRAQRPDYVDYIERTSGFVPLPPRRAVNS